MSDSAPAPSAPAGPAAYVRAHASQAATASLAMAAAIAALICAALYYRSKADKQASGFCCEPDPMSVSEARGVVAAGGTIYPGAGSEWLGHTIAAANGSAGMRNVGAGPTASYGGSE